MHELVSNGLKTNFEIEMDLLKSNCVEFLKMHYIYYKIIKPISYKVYLNHY